MLVFRAHVKIASRIVSYPLSVIRILFHLLHLLPYVIMIFTCCNRTVPVSDESATNVWKFQLMWNSEISPSMFLNCQLVGKLGCYFVYNTACYCRLTVLTAILTTRLLHVLQ